ncbi:UDP-N-acetylmuramoyl-L-alanyl-D-glutamate--2,6-diaminopimelate ligase [Thermostichus vulcanus]|uniref:UDP-N-acetylmuramoyl-L-alanyl-D-glutamate--2,6-diaminopimelate ligase n=1 Tax=Thermostichus vulcanus str. 'Rupite' TaxID=2813851 RepID=A0ABT0C8G7_THEVL|nr:UDP-N-acetylmuramoyl-L-alanyl-D-glutamate--2,6-diaminopimelate ligase [Thermostichus vulcanus]MCJ2542088.1 UDP-N-acetylmuramoyl-L-alanyl-D-glutamate--2,6-diaminopimelate ligase [Thermostichus vulcanus str. 'Rupite']
MEAVSIDLQNLFKQAGIQPHLAQGSLNGVRVRGLCTDSRQVKAGDLFFGVLGTQVDGGRFVHAALQAGAGAALISQEAWASVGSESLQVFSAPIATAGRSPIFLLPAAALSQGIAQVAAAFYGFPARHLTLVGVTGTNGKTTTTHLIEYLLQAAGRPTALLGTLYNRWPGHSQMATHTTLFPIELQRSLNEAYSAGAQVAVMEVSSHALAQDRVWGCSFQAAVWTNLTQDHLDFHPTLEDYWQAKATLFQPEYLQGRALINWDDAGGRRLLAGWDPAQAGATQPEPWAYSLQPLQGLPGLWPTEVELHATGLKATLHTPVGSGAVEAPLVGSFNLSNLLAAVGVALHLGIPLETIQAALPHFPGVPGRVERVTVPGQDITVIVDYAHTPDGLDNLLRAIRPQVQGQLICVFGCGGDRDRGKRPQMGRIAAEWADQVIVTSDNPRTEDPQRILTDIVAGIPLSPKLVEVDRRQAIQQAILSAQPGDTVVIAGKGHEDYQILGTQKIHFDDREEARRALALRTCGSEGIPNPD